MVPHDFPQFHPLSLSSAISSARADAFLPGRCGTLGRRLLLSPPTIPAHTPGVCFADLIKAILLEFQAALTGLRKDFRDLQVRKQSPPQNQVLAPPSLVFTLPEVRLPSMAHPSLTLLPAILLPRH